MRREDFKILWVDPDHLKNFEFILAELWGEGFNIDTLQTIEIQNIMRLLENKQALLIHIGSMRPNMTCFNEIKRAVSETNVVLIVLGLKEALASVMSVKDTDKLKFADLKEISELRNGPWDFSNGFNKFLQSIIDNYKTTS